jgi:hypothetical protein
LCKGTLLDFSSIEFIAVGGTPYHVSVMDRNKHSHFFDTELKNERWRIIDAPKFLIG